jgi:hypothetical protein
VGSFAPSAGLHVAALSLAPPAVVQPIGVLSLVVTVLLVPELVHGV